MRLSALPQLSNAPQATERLPPPLTSESGVPRLSALVKGVLKGLREPSDLAETREVLLELAHRKTGALPPEVLVQQVIAVTDGTDWPTRRAALEALLRRQGFATRDQLTVIRRPLRGAILGVYGLAGRNVNQEGAHAKPTARPYHTELHSVSPIRGSCDCADFLRGSLGFCKHLLVVLEDVLSAPQKVQKAEKQQLLERAEPANPILRWDPQRPWTGDGDRLLGLRLDGLPRLSGKMSDLGKNAKSNRKSLSHWMNGGSPLASALVDLDRRIALLNCLERSLERQEIRAESGARAVVREELGIAHRRWEGRQAAHLLLPHLKTVKRKLYPYQKEGVQRFLEERRLLLADDMGLGKTTQAISACHALYVSNTIQRGLIIVPASLKGQWAREWHATTDSTPLTVVEGRAEERAKLFRQTKKGFLVMNYEQLLRDLEYVQEFAPEIVVLDEAQRIKNWATKSSAYVMSLKPEWRLILTGTPFENRLGELATLLDWVDDTALAPKWRLVPWHTRWTSHEEGGRSGARNLDTLRQRIAPCVVRRLRREVIAQLPPRTDVRVPVEMTEIQRSEHDSLTGPIGQLIQTGLRRPLRQGEFLKLMQLLTQQRIISNGMAQYDFDGLWPTYSRSPADDTLLKNLSSPKLAELRRLISDLVIDQGRRVVVFSQWRSMLRLGEWAIRDLLDEVGCRAVFFTGNESQAQRTRNVVDFHDDPEIRVMFLTDAGGVGLNLQKAASACINLELPWNPAVLEQRIGRIYRLGQELPIDVFNLVSEYGIESRIAGLVGNKKALFSGLFDGTSDEVRFEKPDHFLSDIRRLVDPIVVPSAPASADADITESLEQDTLRSSAENLWMESPPTERVPEHPTLLPAAGFPPEAALVDAAESPSTVAAREAANAGAMGKVPRPQRDPEKEGEARIESRAVPGTSQVAPLFQRVRMKRTISGGLILEADPEAADELAQLLEGMAGLLRSTLPSSRS